MCCQSCACALPSPVCTSRPSHPTRIGARLPGQRMLSGHAQESGKPTRALVVGRVFREDFFDLLVVLRGEVPYCVSVVEGRVAMLDPPPPHKPHTHTRIPSADFPACTSAGTLPRGHGAEAGRACVQRSVSSVTRTLPAARPARARHGGTRARALTTDRLSEKDGLLLKNGRRPCAACFCGRTATRVGAGASAGHRARHQHNGATRMRRDTHHDTARPGRERVAQGPHPERRRHCGSAAHAGARARGGGRGGERPRGQPQGAAHATGRMACAHARTRYGARRRPPQRSRSPHELAAGAAQAPREQEPSENPLVARAREGRRHAGPAGSRAVRPALRTPSAAHRFRPWARLTTPPHLRPCDSTGVLTW